jgi:peptidyl-prolyl cis-trans isomerase D
MMPPTISTTIKMKTTYMLEAIRKRSGGIVVKALLGLLILSFAMWGIADVFSPSGSDQNLAKVGDIEVRPEQVRRDYQREIDRLSSTFGARINAEQARMFGIGQSVVQRLVERTLYDLGAKDLGILASDALVRSDITNQATFKNANGEFERARFEQVLQSNRLTEADFVNLVRGDIMRTMYLSMVNIVPLSPKSMASALYAFRNEQRIAETVTFSYSAVTNVPAPDDAALAKFHKENAVTYTAPEYRKLTFISLTAEEIAKEIAVSDDAIAKAYEERLGDFSEPEKRNLQQIRFKDEATAKQAHSRLKTGDDFVIIAKELANMSADATALGDMKKIELMPALAEAVFSLKTDGFTAPLESVLGWHILRLKGITPAHQKSLAETTPELKEQIAAETAIDSLYKLANRFEDELGGGASLEEAARSLSLKLTSKGEVDNKGMTPAGSLVDNLPGGTFLRVAFSTGNGEESSLTEAGNDGYFIVRVDSVTEPALKSLDSVRADVTEAWNAQQRRQMVQKTGEAMIAALNAGGDLNKLARAKGLSVSLTKPVGRTGSGGTLSQEAVKQLFEARADFSVGAADSKGFTIARLKQTVAANPIADADKLKAMSKELSQSIRGDLLIQLAGALRQRYPVTINTAAINAQF